MMSIQQDINGAKLVMFNLSIGSNRAPILICAKYLNLYFTFNNQHLFLF